MKTRLRHLWQRYQLWRGRRQLRRGMAEVREAMMLLGFPIDHLSDEEIIAGVTKLAGAMAEYGGVSMAEATLAFATLGQAMREGAR